MNKPMNQIVVLACGKKNDCCPELELHEDGSVTVHDTDDGRDQHIVLNAEQASLLGKVLSKRT